MAKHALHETQPVKPGRHSVDSTTASIISLDARRHKTDVLPVVLPPQSWTPEIEASIDVRPMKVHDIDDLPTISGQAHRAAWNEQYKERRYDAASYVSPAKRVHDYDGNEVFTHGHDTVQTGADIADQKQQWQDRVEHHRQQVELAHEMAELANQQSVTEQLPKAS